MPALGLALDVQDRSVHPQRTSERRRRAVLLEQRQRLAKRRRSGLEVAAQVVEDPEPVERTCEDLGLSEVSRARHGRRAVVDPLLDRVSSPPVLDELAGQLHVPEVVALLEQVVEGGPEVVAFRLQVSERVRLGIRPPLVVGPPEHVGDVGGEPVLDVHVGAARRELGVRVFANRLQHPEPRLPARARIVGHEASVEQGVERLRHRGAVVGHGLERVERRSAGEDRQHAEDVPGRPVEKLHAPLDRGPEGSLALRQIRRVARQEREPFAEALCRALRAEHADPGGGQLDRERQAVERAADARDRGSVLVRKHELWNGRPRALDVEPDSGDRVDLLDRAGALARRRQGRDPVLVLGPETKRDAARRQDPKRRCDVEELADERERTRKVLEVVEDDQHPASRERVADDLELCPTRVLLDLEGARHGREH